LWCLDLICFSRPPVSLSLFGTYISFSNFHLALAGHPLHNFVHPAMVAGGLHNQFGQHPSATRCVPIAH
jgi:hypothetical protein